MRWTSGGGATSTAGVGSWPNWSTSSINSTSQRGCRELSMAVNFQDIMGKTYVEPRSSKQVPCV